jgi:hypothetical protein
MAAEAVPRHRLRITVALFALMAVGATGLVVAFRDEGSTAAGRDVAAGEQLRVTLVVRMTDEPLATASATLRLTNTSDRPAWYRGDECDGPGRPAVGPAATGPGPGTAAGTDTLWERLVEAGERSLRVELAPSDPGRCDPDPFAARIEPGETVTREYRSGVDPVDRSSPVEATVVVRESNRRGRTTARLRPRVPFPELPGGGALTIERAVDAFLADPTVDGLVAEAGADALLVGVSRRGPVWRMSLGSGAGDLSAEVHPDLTVRDVDLTTPAG